MGTLPKLNESKSTFNLREDQHGHLHRPEGHGGRPGQKGVDTEGKTSPLDLDREIDGKPRKLENHPIADMAAYKMVNGHRTTSPMT